MITAVLDFALGMLAVSILLGLVRLARGPSVADRVLAFDLVTTCAVGMIVLLSMERRTAIYLELVLIFSLLGFLSTVAFVIYLRKTSETTVAPEPKDAASTPGVRRP
jgi:multicomponent K+:H+ antiporter subunit F